MKLVTFNKAVSVVALGAAILASGSCAGANANSKSASYIVIELLEAQSGSRPGAQFSGRLDSDVVTNVDRTVGGVTTSTPTVFSDIARAQFRMGLKRPGASEAPTEPSRLNDITVTRYRIEYRRTDGRNRPGIDVPYPIEGGATTTFAFSSVTLIFDLVRISSKLEPPLINLRNVGGSVAINVIAFVTFYGHDQHGNGVSATGEITINFADFGD